MGVCRVSFPTVPLGVDDRILVGSGGDPPVGVVSFFSTKASAEPS
jgi:hypothetical protein